MCVWEGSNVNPRNRKLYGWDYMFVHPSIPPTQIVHTSYLPPSLSPSLLHYEYGKPPVPRAFLMRGGFPPGQVSWTKTMRCDAIVKRPGPLLKLHVRSCGWSGSHWDIRTHSSRPNCKVDSS